MQPAIPKHFIFTTFGSAGDVHPLIGVGRELQDRGHAVTLIAHDYFASRIQQAGLGFLPLGFEREYQEVLQNPDLWHPRKSFKVIARSIVSSLRRFYSILAEENPQDKILVAPGLSLWTRLLQEKLNWRLVTLHLQPSMLWSAHDTPVMPGFRFPHWMSPAWKKRIWYFLNHWVTDRELAPELNRFRQELGLNPVKNIFLDWMHSPELVIGAFPAWFAAVQSDWPKNTQLTSFIYYDQVQDSAFEDSLVRQALDFCEAGDPPLLFTAGSAMTHAKDFFEQSLEACKRLKRRAIFVAPSGSEMPKLDDSFRYFSYLPFGKIASKLAAMVHHGGIGTAAQALRVGIPQLVVPLTHDQPDNAERLKKLGVARSLDSKQYSARSALEKLQDLLYDPRVAERCQYYATRIAREKDGGTFTAELLESFAEDRNKNSPAAPKTTGEKASNKK